MGFNFVEKFKDIESTAHASSTFQIFFQKKIFRRKPSKPGHGNLVLIFQVKWDGEFDGIRTNFRKVLTYYS